MNKKLLKDEVPKEILDCCLLHEVANIDIDFGIDIIERKEEIAATITDNFTKKEIRTMTEQGDLLVIHGEKVVDNPKADGSNKYHSDNDSCEIRLDDDADKTGITHELIHHLRVEDPERKRLSKTAYELDKGGHVINDSKTASNTFAEEYAIIAKTIFSRIKGNEYEYSDGTVEWLTSDEFVQTNQPVYISRDMRIGSEEGVHRSIEDSLNGLKDRKLISENLRRARFFWSKGTSSKQSAWPSILMKVIIVNAELDLEDTPNDVSGFVIIRQISMRSDLRTNNDDRKQAVMEAVQSHLGFDSIQEWMEERGFFE